MATAVAIDRSADAPEVSVSHDEAEPAALGLIRRVTPSTAGTGVPHEAAAVAPISPSSPQVEPTPEASQPATVTSAEVATTTVRVPGVVSTTEPPTTLLVADGLRAAERTLRLAGTIGGDIAPKSIVASGHGRFVAQNMMYRHTVTLYDRSLSLLATIPDAVDLSAYGLGGEPGSWQGAPVEAAFTSDGHHAYVTNYQMYGPGFDNPGSDGCNAGDWDPSFVYRIDVDAARVDQVIAVGAVPKYVAVTPDDRYVLVTNWCDFDLSVIDIAAAAEVARVPLGRHPRGIAVTADSATAYVAVMGSRDVAVVDLAGRTVSWIQGVGANPRHVVLSPDGRSLYVTNNGDGTVAKLDVAAGAVVANVATGRAPRSMAISDDGTALYVVNYESNTLSKVRTDDMAVIQDVATAGRPIGVTYDGPARQVWVANYSGSIQVFIEA